MNKHYRDILKKRNKLYTEYKVISERMILQGYSNFVRLDKRRKKVYKEFKFYQTYLECIDNEKRN